MLTEVRFEQFSNALMPIFVIDDGMSNVVKAVWPLNAFVFNVVTADGIFVVWQPVISRLSDLRMMALQLLRLS